MSEINIPWPDWKAVKRIGNGSYGSVYEIERQDGFGHTEKAALKVISIPKEESDIDSLAANGYDDESITEYYRTSLNYILGEYALMIQLKSHPNIVSVDDRKAVQQENGIGWNVYIRMELLVPFVKYIKGKEFNEQEIIKLGKDLLNALQACHSENIIHRDIKPENIFVTKFGDYKLGDFGVARIMSHTTNATKTGTPYYMAPEVYKSERYGKEADIYSLGMVLYWLLNNRKLPFEPADHLSRPDEKEEARQKRLTGKAVPDPINGNERLKSIVKKALAYDSKERYGSAEEMLEELLNINEKEIENAPLDCLNKETNNESMQDNQIIDEANVTKGKAWGINSGTIEPDASLRSDLEFRTARHTIATEWRKHTGSENVLSEKQYGSNPVMKKTSTDQTSQIPKTEQVKIQLNKDEEITLSHVSFIDDYVPMPGTPTIAKSMFSTVFGKNESSILPSDIIAVSKHTTHCVYLRSNGTVVARGENNDGKCIVSYWKNITAIATGLNHTVGLRANGTVMATGDNDHGQCLVSGWSDICAIVANENITVGLKKDGRVVATGLNHYEATSVSEWTDIVAISAGWYFTIGLKSDGTVVATGYNNDGQCNVTDWEDIVAISAGNYHTVGLKADGTVEATGKNDNGQCDVSVWKGIIAVSAGSGYTLGWKSNGSLLVAGKLPLKAITDWKLIESISTARCHKVCLSPNGKVSIKGVSFDGASAGKTVKEYEDIINWKRKQAHIMDWLYIELEAGDLLEEVEKGINNLSVTCQAMLNCMLEGDQFIIEPVEKNRVSKSLTIRYYCDKLGPDSMPYIDG